MGMDGDQDEGEALPPLSEEDDGRIDVGLLVQNELAGIRGMGAEAEHVDLGPRPRALSQARIQVKSDASSPKVRSSKLRPRRRMRTGSRPLLELDQSEGAEREVPSLGRQAPRTAPLLPDVEEIDLDGDVSTRSPRRRRLLIPLQVIAALLLLQTALMPTLRVRRLIPPWAAWTDPASPNFVALAFLGLLALFFAFPLSRLFRTALQGLGAILLLVFALVLMRSAMGLGLFDGQPALHALFIDGFSAGLIALIAACVLPTALFWLGGAPESVGARRTVMGGIALVLVSYLALGPLVDLETSPLTLLVQASTKGEFAGDRLASKLAFLPFLGACVSVGLSLPKRKSTWAGAMGLTMWVVTVLPLITLALFVAPFERWHDVLVPLQIMILLSAGLLLASTSLGHVLAVLEVGDD